jgi:subtilisin family serine protease
MNARLKQLAVAAVSATTLALLVIAPVTSARSSAGTSRQAPLTAKEARALSTNVSDRVIVVFKNQFGSIPDTPAERAHRASAVGAVQQPVVSELALTRATHVRRFQLINAVAAYVSRGEAKRLAANPAVAEVVPDGRIPLVPSPPVTLPHRHGGPSGSSGSLAETCPAPGRVQLNPQAVETIHAAEPPGGGPSAQGLGYTGAGVKVGFIADGLDITNKDFIRANGQPVFVDYQDFSGTGTSAPTDGGEAFGDASSIAAQGREVYNLADVSSTVPNPCNIRVLGVAPGASLVGLNVFGSSNFAYNSVFVAAINYAVNTDHVNVLNESFGGNPFPDQGSLDVIRMADEAAVAAGVTVTASTGDAGVTNTIGSPGTDPAVISAGGTTTYRSYAQAGVGGINFPGVTGWLNDNISGLSSAGFDQTGATEDVVAPADLNWALCSPDPNLYAACSNGADPPQGLPLELFGGTSEAAPLTAGVAALVIQAYEQSHGGTAPSPAVVKQIIVSTAQDVSAPAEQQGAGMLDAYAAVQAAASYPGSHAATGHALIKGTPQLNAVGSAGAPEYFSESVTNTGDTAQPVVLSSRALGAYRQIAHTTVQLTDATNNEATVKFFVRPGQARLNASITWVGVGSSLNFAGADNLSLISPSGKLAEYSIPQGNGNYGNAQVANPEPGTWTALIFGTPSVDGGSVGPVQFAAATANWIPFGQLSTHFLYLAPGASRTFSLNVRNPWQPGDEAGSIVLTSLSRQPRFASTTTVPVTLRSLVPTPNPTTTFTGTLTGGNGRETNTGQTAYYQVYVPSGLPELNASVSTGNPANTFVAELIDPVTGEAASTTTNDIPGSGGTLLPENGGQLHVLHPDAGLWTIAVDFYNQVSGTAIAQPFTVTLNRTPVPVSASLPAGTTLAAGTPTTVAVKVTNTGGTPEAYFTDARLPQIVQLNLAPLTTAQTSVPISSPTVPMFLVPTHTTSVTASATAPAPIYFDFWSSWGDPDVITGTSDAPAGTFTLNPVVAGDWGITPFQKGPDGANGVTPVTANTAMSATTAAFDSAVKSSTGDFWLQAVNASAPVNPVIVSPGQTATIPVTITPSGASGTVVNGTLYVDDLTSASGLATNQELSTVNVSQASDLAALPYQYKIR